MTDIRNYSKMICFVLPLSELIPFPGARSFHFLLDSEIRPSETGPIILDDRELPGDIYPDGLKRFVFIRAYNSSHVGTGKAATNVKIAEAVLKQVAPNLTPGKDNGRQSGDTHITTLVMQTPLFGDSEQDINDAFKLCLKYANKLLDALGGVRAEAFSSLNEVNVPSLIFRITRAVSSLIWEDLGLYITSHMNDVRSENPTIYSNEEMERVTANLVAVMADHPAINYNRLRSAANKAHFREVDFRTAVIMDFAAGEVMLNSTLMLLLWEGGKSPAEAATHFQYPTAGLKSRIGKFYSPILGGSGWSFKGGGPVVQWYKIVAKLRGRCVHSGYIPTHPEADSSNRLTDELARFMINKIKSKQRQYPVTCAATLGSDKALVPGVKEFNEWKTNVDEIIEASE